jgi:type II secretory pathway pseudopilin PulG
MENNYTSQEHSRDSGSNVVMESAGRTIARMRERQRGRNFVNGVVISCLALATVVTGVLLGATSRYANNLRSELNSVQQQNQALTQQLGNGQNGQSGGIGSYSGNMGSMQNGTNGSTTSGMNDGMNSGSMGGSTMGGSSYGSSNSYGSGRYNGYRRNWRNFNNNNNGGVAPVSLPTTNNGNGYGSNGGTGSNGTGSAATSGSTYSGSVATGGSAGSTYGSSY